MLNCLLVGCGGFIGAVFRYIMGISLFQDTHFPYTTLLINVIGAFLMGFFTELAGSTQIIPARLRLFLTTGLLGGFTTFSAFSLEAVGLFEQGKTFAGTMYAIFSVLLCLGGIILGKAVVRVILKK